ncbi:hypothetical protein [Janibacter terrae]|uniref:hypothetical protein n=1 Tax=Janibacter terrae TaxID=103817 RepID=UPI0009ED991C|nr:hypothetical protein [Janibacter terrae]
MDDNAVMDRLRGTEEEAALLAVAEGGGQVWPGAVDKVTGGRRATVGAVSALQDLGLVDREQSAAYEVTLTRRGRRVAERITDSRTDGRDRADAVRLGLLRWLKARTERPGTADLYAEDEEATAYGVPFTVEEIRHAVAFLREHSLIVGTGSMQGPFLRPGLTPEGRNAVDSGLAVSDHVRGGPSSQTFNNTANFHGGNVAGVQVGGQGNSMDVVMTVTNEERTQVLAGLAEVCQTLDDAGVTSPEVREAVEAIHEEAAKPDASRPALRERITEAVAVAAVTEGAPVILQGLGALLAMIPM